MKKNILSLFLSCFLFVHIYAQQATQWRGANSEAKYPAPNLIAQWLETGPEVIWHFDELGDGFSSPVFANGKIYIAGMANSLGYISILNESGQLIKKVEYGTEFEVSYPGSRATPTIVGDLAYISTGYGELICVNLETGKRLWSKNLSEDFGSENLRFGFTESIVVDGDQLYFTPGGKDFNLVAFNRISGDLIWKSSGNGKLSAYCTPKLVQVEGRQILVTHMSDDIVAVDTRDGKVLWTYPHPNQYNIHPNTPILQDGDLLCFSGYGQGCVRLHLNADGSAVTKVWSTEKMDNQMGGAEIVDGFIYGSGHKSRGWYCLDWKTGEEKWQSSALGNGVIIMAGDKFIIYSERGELALVNPNPSDFEIISKAKVEFGTAQHWAHPVVYNDILYVRHGNSLIAYKISV
ncbi:outer membrane protein assembly factor BamB family protein [Mangrovibacterium lignilyticum]|uniref:outer membrane protein assembly factor BamB family protein n=1 Tax=Mangrovibacterium lignilyticum TaxID=2668052 RepID=UPI0013D89D10|nr:PQQ-binding-like beta-propeller repeat protein [Mangrovibacterium lignilyticum]